MRGYHFPEGPGTAQYLMLASDLLDAPTVHTGEWQAMNTTGSPAHETFELENVALVWDRMPTDLLHMFPAVDLMWANEHFRERVSGQPLNPAPSHVRWPYAVRGNAMHTDDSTRFDHTYPERFWPKRANVSCPSPEECQGNHEHMGHYDRRGIRFAYGDLNDVVDLLVRSPLTRQAFLPVWFPEDTGAVEGQRVPCTLGYHFMQRGGRLSCRYYLRSCDLYRHLSNDVYFAALLTRWITDQVWERTKDNDQKVSMRPGGLEIYISSLHAFKGDVQKIRDRIDQVSHLTDGAWGVAV